MDHIPRTCAEHFNLGHGEPVSVPELISILEEQLKRKARIQELPVPATEILKTWADISESEEQLHYHPKTNLTVGVRNFAAWYMDYRKRRKEQASLGRPSDSQDFYERCGIVPVFDEIPNIHVE